MKLHPFRALHPTPQSATRVASPPYDVISTSEAHALAAGNPDSFLHVIRPEIDLPSGTDLYADEVYAMARTNLDRLVARGALVEDVEPAIWLYQLTMGEHQQVGFFGLSEVADYAAQRIKKHEFTRPDKEDDRTRHVDTLQAHAGPVFLTCPDPSGDLTRLQQRLMGQAPPLIDIVAHHDVRHQLWRISSAPDLAAIAGGFAPVSAFYIADGHHRAASALRARDLARGRAPSAPTDAAFERFATVVFPAPQLQVLAYNRVLHDLNGHTVTSLLTALEPHFEMGPAGHPGADTPTEARQFGIYLGGQWRTLRARPTSFDASDPVASLDVSILQDLILAPLLGIEDPRRSSRISFVGGIRGTKELSARVDAQGQGCAFSLFPTSVDELLRVADTGEVMPPKSTWFEPKLASGLLIHRFGD